MQVARAAALAPQRPALRVSSSSRRAALVVRSSSAAGFPGAPQLPSVPLLRLTAAAAALVQRGVAAAKAATAQAARQIAEEDLNAQIKTSMKQMRMLALVAPFAAVSGLRCAALSLGPGTEPCCMAGHNCLQGQPMPALPRGFALLASAPLPPRPTSRPHRCLPRMCR